MLREKSKLKLVYNNCRSFPALKGYLSLIQKATTTTITPVLEGKGRS